MIMSDIWTRGIYTARIFDHIRLSGQRPLRRRPTRAEEVDQREDRVVPRISEIGVFGR